MNSIYTIKDLHYQYPKTRQTGWSWFSGKKTAQEDSQDQADKGNVFELGPLSLDIKKGKLTSILGRSGSGKTTLLSLIGLLRKPTSGDATIHAEEDISIKVLWQKNQELELFRSNHLGFALQKGELLPHLSLYENASLVSAYLKNEETEISQRIEQQFEALYEQEYREKSLSRIMNQKPSHVSQGQYQRGAIVRALANNPSIILADEPTGNLDIHSGEKAMRIFRHIVEETSDKSVIVVTHDRKLAVDFADEIIILTEGKVKSRFVIDRDSAKAKRFDADGIESELESKDALMHSIGSDLD